jgi:hypothetical protein
MKRSVQVAGLLAVVGISMASGAMIHALLFETKAQTQPGAEKKEPVAATPLISLPTPGPTFSKRVLMGVNATRFLETITVYDFDLTSGFSPYAYTLSWNSRARGVFIQVLATFVNISDSELVIDNSEDFRLIDETGIEYRVSTPAAITPRELLHREVPIADIRARPGEAYNALLHFDIPRTGYQRNLKLRFRDEPPLSFRAMPTR